ncbi:MAG: tRNA lysidine(34) synthetase TilS [Myxococcaceae bacterium]
MSKDQAITRFLDGLTRSSRRLWGQRTRVLVAISGGADSRALLSGLHAIAARLELQLEAATIDHGLRPTSAEEARKVGAWCAALGVIHHVVAVDLSAVQTGVEEAARQARYAALARVRDERGLGWIATAHTASDQAETVLMRLLRGASPGGLAGIHEARADRVARPLLFATRGEVEAYLTAKGLDWVHDEMNDDPQFLRVRVRREVVPVLSALGGDGVVQRLARVAQQAAEDEGWLASEATRALERLKAGDELDGAGLLELPSPLGRRVLAQWLGDRGLPIDGELIADGLRAVREGGTATLPHDRVLACKNGRVRVLEAPPRLHATSSGTDGRNGA